MGTTDPSSEDRGSRKIQPQIAGAACGGSSPGEKAMLDVVDGGITIGHLASRPSDSEFALQSIPIPQCPSWGFAQSTETTRDQVDLSASFPPCRDRIFRMQWRLVRRKRGRKRGWWWRQRRARRSAWRGHGDRRQGRGRRRSRWDRWQHSDVWRSWLSLLHWKFLHREWLLCLGRLRGSRCDLWRAGRPV
jgi:hypothetical protein